jgi:hypothetical protein
MLVVLCKNVYTVSYLTLKLASLYVCFSIRLFILHGRFDRREANTMLNDIRDGCAYCEVSYVIGVGDDAIDERLRVAMNSM